MDVFGRQPHGEDFVQPDEEDGEDVHLGTAGMMFDEWADWVGGLMPRAYQMPDPTKANVR
jgi:hypothetical protein